MQNIPGPMTPGATSPAVSDGIYLMVRPLSVGDHTIQFGFTNPGVPPQPPFTSVITYDITVTPGQKISVFSPTIQTVSVVEVTQ